MTSHQLKLIALGTCSVHQRLSHLPNSESYWVFKITHWQCYCTEGQIVIKIVFATKLHVRPNLGQRTCLKCAFRKKILRIRAGVKWLIAWLNCVHTLRDVKISSEFTLIFLCFILLNFCKLTKTVYIKCIEVI